MTEALSHPKKTFLVKFYGMQVLNYVFMALIFSYCKYFDSVHATTEKVGLRAVVCVSSFTDLPLFLVKVQQIKL